MDQVLLYERLGGEDGVDALVRELYARLLGDPDISVELDRAEVDTAQRDDRRHLATILGAPMAGLLRRDAEAVLGHLRDVLWLRGAPAGLVDEVVDAVRRATATMSS